MSFLDRLNTPKNYPFDRTDGYYHFSLGRMRSAPLDDSRNFIISVTTIDEIPEQKIQEVFDQITNWKACSHGFWINPKENNLGWFISPEMLAEGFGKLAHHFPRHYDEVRDICEDVSHETTVILLQLALGVPYDKVTETGWVDTALEFTEFRR